ncbi:hypothetical protein [Adhaeribacter soli]|nr:hypothetical protein [Adhaeribacter soli]
MKKVQEKSGKFIGNKEEQVRKWPLFAGNAENTARKKMQKFSILVAGINI